MCRGRAPQPELLRFALLPARAISGGTPRADGAAAGSELAPVCAGAVAAGRGAYCHATPECLLHPGLGELLRYAMMRADARGSVSRAVRRGKSERSGGVSEHTAALRAALLRELERDVALRGEQSAATGRRSQKDAVRRSAAASENALEILRRHEGRGDAPAPEGKPGNVRKPGGSRPVGGGKVRL